MLPTSPTSPTFIQQSITSHIDEVVGCGLSTLLEDASDNICDSISSNRTFIKTTKSHQDSQLSINNLVMNNYSCSTSLDTSDLPTTTSLLSMSYSENDVYAAQKGYKFLCKVCDTLQGQLFKAEKIVLTPSNNLYESAADSAADYFAIKKISKELYTQTIARRGDINFCVSENIRKEALILKYLTVSNKLNGDYIGKMIDYFETESHLYLVTEYINGMNLRQFVNKAHIYITNGKLDFKQYSKLIKFIMWQLSAVLIWLHDVYHCAHLDLWCENIMLNNIQFIENCDGSINIKGAVKIKLIDFGNAEIFMSENDTKYFECSKPHLTLDNGIHEAPELHYDSNRYNAKAIDMWCLGVILYECMTGEQLFIRFDSWKRTIQSKCCYWNASNTELKRYLAISNQLKMFNGGAFSLLDGLLQLDQRKRFNISDVIQSKWLSKYYKKYGDKINSKIISDTQRLKHNKQHIKHIAYCN